MATFKLALSPPLHRASSRYYYLLVAKALPPVQRAERQAVLQQHRSCKCTTAEWGSCQSSSCPLRELQTNKKNLMVWLRSSFRDLSALSSILSDSRQHPFSAA